MNQQIDFERFPLEEWKTEILRLTAFPVPSGELQEPSWWTDLTGEPPEKKIWEPKKQRLQEEGVVDDKKVVLRVEPTRINWLFVPSDEDQFRDVGFSTVGVFPEVLETFFSLMLHWLELGTCPSLLRLAFGAVLLRFAESKEMGYRCLSPYLHSVRLDPEGSSDFVYQINRPRDSRTGIPDLRINRLSKWSVATLRGFSLSAGPLPAMQPVPASERFACRLELDINTSQYFQEELRQEQLAVVFRELVDLAREIISEGDIS